MSTAPSPSAATILRGLSAAEIKRRLKEIDAEQRALRVLLRAADRMESARETTAAQEAKL